MAAIGLAIVGKDNGPLYVREFLSPHDPFDGGDDEAAALFGLKPLPSSGKPTASERFWFVLHAALDRLEQLTLSLDGKKKILPHHSFVGLLLPLEETRVYGYQTNTQIKFLLIVEDEGPNAVETIAADAQQLLEELHELYVREVMNPFSSDTNDTVDGSSNRMSHKFDERVQKHIASFNQPGTEI